MTATVLATGGAGYIGSHVVAELLAAGHRAVILDDFSNADPAAVDRIAAIGVGRPELVVADARDAAVLDALFRRFRIDAVVHLAGLKAVAESVARPLDYYAVNVGGVEMASASVKDKAVQGPIVSTSPLVCTARAQMVTDPGSRPVGSYVNSPVNSSTSSTVTVVSAGTPGRLGSLAVIRN